MTLHVVGSEDAAGGDDQALSDAVGAPYGTDWRVGAAPLTMTELDWDRAGCDYAEVVGQSDQHNQGHFYVRLR